MVNNGRQEMNGGMRSGLSTLKNSIANSILHIYERTSSYPHLINMGHNQCYLRQNG
jgi:hypothetical protein